MEKGGGGGGWGRGRGREKLFPSFSQKMFYKLFLTQVFTTFLPIFKLHITLPLPCSQSLPLATLPLPTPATATPIPDILTCLSSVCWPAFDFPVLPPELVADWYRCDIHQSPCSFSVACNDTNRRNQTDHVTIYSNYGIWYEICIMITTTLEMGEHFLQQGNHNYKRINQNFTLLIHIIWSLTDSG